MALLELRDLHTFFQTKKGTVKAGGASVNKIEEWNFSDALDDADEVKAQFSENLKITK